MKQRRFGKKVQNWHRPLGPNQKKTRYLKNKDLDPLLDQHHEPNDGVPDFFIGFSGECFSGDEFWSVFDATSTVLSFNEKDGRGLQLFPLRNTESLSQFADSKEWHLFQNWLEDLAAPSDLELTMRETVGPLSFTERYKEVREESPERDDEVDDRLLQQIAINSKNIAEHTRALKTQISEAIGDGSSLIILRESLHSGNNHKLLEHVILFSPFWVREPSSWLPNQELSLLEHLFCIYKVPKFLLNEWYRREDYVRYKWIAWCILMGQGVSLHKAGKKLNWNIPKGMPHFLYQVPEDLSPTLSCIYAEILRLKGSEEVFGRIIQHTFFIRDVTEPNWDESHRRFWTDTVLWFTRHIDEISPEQSLDLLNWGVFCHKDAYHNNQEAFKWSGRSLQHSLEHAARYNDGLAKRWKGHDWNWEWTDVKGKVWRIKELTTETELYKEGAAMRHCVLTHTSMCLDNESAIFSLTRNGKRCLTVDVYPETMEIDEARGKTNRDPKKEERAILRLWHGQLRDPESIHIIATQENLATLVCPEDTLRDILVILDFAISNYDKTELDVFIAKPKDSWDKLGSLKEFRKLISTQEGRCRLAEEDIRLMQIVLHQIWFEVESGWIKFVTLPVTRLELIADQIQAINRELVFEMYDWTYL